MRKWLLAPAVLLLAIGCIYWFIPAELTVVQITPVHCPVTAAFRSMSTDSTWQKWWPSKETGDSILQYKNSRYRFTKTLLNTLEVQIQQGGLVVNSTVNLLPLPADSVAIQWKCTIPSGIDPFTRIQRYQQALALKKDLMTILAGFGGFAEKKENLYGIAIRETSFKDSLLIATKTTTSAYPSTTDIYSMVQALKKYSAGQLARQTGYPILNITPLDSSRFQIMAALPVDKRLPDKGAYFHRNMVPGKFLFTTVQGGEGTIQHTYKQLQLYVEDFRRTAMAIPFQMLVTDRSAQPDTAKWVTHIYVPVF